MFKPDILQDKIAVITGAGTGIGRTVALELARHGAHIVLAARKADRLEAAAEEVRALGRRALVIPTDVTEHKQVKNLIESAKSEFGCVDIMINNAAANFIRPSRMLTAVRWKKIIDIVLNGSFHGCLEAGKVMLEQGGGVIVNIVATYVWHGAPGLAPSASAKAGVVTLTKTLGAEWAASGVRVNAIAPGFIDTPQARDALWPTPEMKKSLVDSIPAKRFGTEKDVSDLIIYLASPMGGYINGETIVADGGHHLGKGALEFLDELKAVRKK